MSLLTAPFRQPPTLEQALAQRWALLPPEKIQQHIQRQLQEAGIPALFRSCTFQTLDPGHDPQAYQICQDYAQAGQYQGKKGLLLFGQPGNGKTCLAVAVLRHTIEQTKGRCSVRFWNVSEGLSQLRHRFEDAQQEAESLLELTYNRLVVLDDLGQQKMTEWVAEQFYTLVNALWSQDKQLVVTTNLGPAEFRHTLDPALVSRLTGHCHPVVLKGEDLRQQHPGRIDP